MEQYSDKQRNGAVSLLSGDRPLPHNDDAEIAVLGSILLDPDLALDTAVSVLKSADSFYNPAHKQVFNAILQLGETHGKNPSTIDLVTLSDFLRKKGLLEQVGGGSYLARIMNSVPTAANVEYYVDIVRQNAILRRLIKTGTEIVEKSFNQRVSVKELVDEIEGEVLRITQTHENESAVAIGDKVLSAIEFIDKLHQQDQSALGLQTGYTELDRILMGLHPGEMFVLAARPSIGKTALALNIAESIALASDPASVGIFSLEMSIEQLVLRQLCSLARINLSDIRECAVSKGRWQEIMSAGQRLKKAPIYIDDSSAGLDVAELRARARRMKREQDIQILLIDYLQLLKPVNANRNTTRENEVSQISGGIKSLANELQIPIIVLAQLNRQAAQAGQKPRLSQLRESGAIEQDADVVALLHRERETENESYTDSRTPIEAELIVAKHRNGQTGRVPLVFIPAYTRFEMRSPVNDEDVPE
ncbi:MAG: replicative DNA helicase [Verrucomicrobiota bacterium]